MAATYTVNAANVAYAYSKNMFGVCNPTGSGKTVKLYRLWLLNSCVPTQAGTILAIMTIGRFAGSTYEGGTSLSFLKHKTSSSSAGSVIARVGATTSITVTDVIRRVGMSTQEPSGSVYQLPDMERMVPLCCCIDSGYGCADIEPITLAENQGIVVQTPSSGFWEYGTCDFFAEVTIS